MTRMLVIRSYFRKSRLQVSVIAIMLVLASMIMGLATVLLLDYKDNYFRIHDRLNAEHIVMNFAVANQSCGSVIADKLAEDTRVSEYEITQTAFTKGSCQYGDDGLMSAVFTFMRFSDVQGNSVGKYEITEEISTGDGYIPYIFSANGFYEPGDTFTVKTGSVEKSFVIKGFYNNLTTGTVNCRDVAILLTDEKYAELTSDTLTGGCRACVRLNEPENAQEMEPELINELSDARSGIVFADATNYIKLSTVRYISETIFAGILCAAAAVIAAVLLAIVAVSLSNYIKENMRNLGIMKAVGYESRNLSGPVILSLAILAAACSSVGYALAYCFLPVINNMLECQSGIPYEIHFLWLPGVITAGTMLVCVVLTAVLSIAKIRTILPIMAIRPVKNNGKSVNVLPLSKTGTGLDLALGIKTVFSNLKKYIVFMLSSCLITVMLCVAAYCVDHILNSPENIVRLVMGNIADVSLNVSAAEEEQLKQWLQSRDDVENAYVYTHCSVCHEGGDRIDAVVRDEEGNNQSGYLLTEGVLPGEDNEVAVNFAYAREQGLKVGDEMILTRDGNRYSYVICGMFQDALSSGKNVALSREGYEKLSTLSNVSYLINLTQGTDIDGFISELSSSQTVSAINHRDFVSGLSATYVSMLNALVTIIVVVSLLIAAMVLSVIVNMILFNKRREHGIMKSLGFVTGQIVFQTAVSFVPVALLGSLAGMLISYKGVSVLFASFVRSIGIYSFGDSVSLPYLAACGILFTLFTFSVTCVLSLKVRKTVPHDLFNNE